MCLNADSDVTKHIEACLPLLVAWRIIKCEKNECEGGDSFIHVSLNGGYFWVKLSAALLLWFYEIQAVSWSWRDHFLPTEKTCLLVCRSNKGSEVPLSPSLQRHNISQMVFHKISKDDLEFVSPVCVFTSEIFARFPLTFKTFRVQADDLSSDINALIFFLLDGESWSGNIYKNIQRGPKRAGRLRMYAPNRSGHEGFGLGSQELLWGRFLLRLEIWEYL